MARQVAHEIKNPLTPISLSANLLLRARKDDAAGFDDMLERTIEMIQRQVSNMRDIAADFSAFAGARAAEPEHVELAALVHGVLEFERAWAQELGVELVETGSGGGVFADRRELERVLINLVSNALEAMPDGSGVVMIDGKMQDDATWKQAKVIVDLAKQVAAKDAEYKALYGF